MGQGVAVRLCRALCVAGTAVLVAHAGSKGKPGASKGSREGRNKNVGGQGVTGAAVKKVRAQEDGASSSLRYARVLTAVDFARKVQKVVNGTVGGKRRQKVPMYYPVVMFHADWCEHCHKALPEFDQAAEKVVHAVEAGQVQGYPILPRFYVMQCTTADDSQDICNRYTGGTFPSLVFFRQHRAFLFNRPRIASTIAWWSMRLTRPAVIELMQRRHLEQYGQEVLFILFADSKKDMNLIMDWSEIALDYLDQYTFAVAQPFATNEIANASVSAPRVDLKAPRQLGLEKVPLRGAMGRQTLEAWVNFNQFPPVVELTRWTAVDVQRSGLRVVVLVHDGGSGSSQLRQEFRLQAKEWRRRGRYLFAMVNASDPDALKVLNIDYPLLAPPAAQLPRIFAFMGRGLYWEDPRIDNASSAAFEAIEEMFFDPFARSDGSMGSWLKGKRKLYTRFAMQSWTALFTVIMIPFAFPSVCWILCSSMCSAPEDRLVESEEEEDRKDNQMD